MFKRFTLEQVLLVLGIAAGIVGFAAARSYLIHAERAAADQYAQRYTPRKVVVAAAELQSGDSLLASKLAVRDMPQRFLPSTAVPEDELDAVLDSTVLATLKPGDPIERNLLRSSPPSMANSLPAGFRALALAAETLGPIGDILKSGDHVDLWLEGAPTATGTVANRVILDVTILAVDYGAETSPSGEVRGERSISLLLTPDEAALIVEAQRTGSIAATLRSSLEPAAGKIAPDAVTRAAPGKRSRRSQDLLELFSADGQSVSRHLLAAGGLP